jgi:hypothetical protein
MFLMGGFMHTSFSANAVGLLFACLLPVAAQALTLETTNFISSPTYSNGFEGFGTTGVSSGPSYSEGGITVSNGGGFGPSIGAYPYWDGVGTYQWYNANHYADITLTGGGQIQSIQFLASSGFNSPVNFNYEVLNSGTIVASGTTLLTAYCCADGKGFEYLGFSGGGFDELRLQANFASAFDPSSFDALALDNIAAIPVSATPLPAALPLFASGGGLFGFFGWWRRRRSVALA